MSTLKKFAEASLTRGVTIPLMHEEVQNIHNLFDSLPEAIELIVPEAMPSVLMRQAAAETKMLLVECAKKAGITWRKDECGSMHGEFIVSRAYMSKCCLCDRMMDETKEEDVKEWRNPFGEDDDPVVIGDPNS